MIKILELEVKFKSDYDIEGYLKICIVKILF